MFEKEVSLLTKSLSDFIKMDSIEEKTLSLKGVDVAYSNFYGDNTIVYKINNLIDIDLYHLINEVSRTTQINDVTIDFENYSNEFPINLENAILNILEIKHIKYLSFENMHNTISTLTIPSIDITNLYHLRIDQRAITISIEDNLEHKLETISLRVKEWDDVIILSQSDDLVLIDIICESKVGSKAIYGGDIEGLKVTTKSSVYETFKLINFDEIGTMHINDK